MKTISVVCRKGGVGKTATAHALGAGLIKRGFTVLYVDLDSQSNLTFGLGADPSGYSAMEVLTGEATAKEAIKQTDHGDIITGYEDLAGADFTLKDKGKEYKLKHALTFIELDYDYCVIDTPAQLGILTVNALTASNIAVIPVQADIFSLQGIGQLNKTITAVKERSNPNLEIRGILITRYNPRTVLSQDMLENLGGMASQLGTKLFKTPIRECIAVKEAQAYQQDIFTYAPRSNASQDYDAFINEFMEGETPAWAKTSKRTRRPYF